MAHSEAQDRSHSHPPCRGAVWWCLLAVALPAAFLAARLTLDLWGDEVYTLYFYAGRSAATIATDYSAPNNHILYSLLLRPVYQFSEAAPILRLPSFLFALGTLMLVFWLALRCAGTTAAVATTSLLGLNQMFLSHAIQVRGYSLQMLLFAALIALAWQSPMKRSWIHYCVVVPLGAALLYVMPTSGFFLFPTSLLAVWANWQSRRSARAVVGELTAWGLAWGCGLLLYWPVADQMLASAREQNTTPIAQRAQLLTDLAWAMTRDAWWLAPAMLLGVFAWRRRQDRQTNPLAWQLPRAMLFLLVVPLVIAVAVRTTPFSNFVHCSSPPRCWVEACWENWLKPSAGVGPASRVTPHHQCSPCCLSPACWCRNC